MYEIFEMDKLVHVRDVLVLNGRSCEPVVQENVANNDLMYIHVVLRRVALKHLK